MRDEERAKSFANHRGLTTAPNILHEILIKVKTIRGERCKNALQAFYNGFLNARDERIALNHDVTLLRKHIFLKCVQTFCGAQESRSFL